MKSRSGPDKIESFLRQQNTQDLYEVERFELRQIGYEGQSHKVRTWMAMDQDIHELAAEMYETAYEDAEASSGGVSTYYVAAYAPNEVGWKERSPKFRLSSGRLEANDEDILDMAESPSLKAQFSQILRHNEASFRTAVGAAQGIIDRQAGTIELLVSKLDRNIEERFEMLDVYEKLQLHQAEQAREERREATKAQLMEDGLKAVKMLGPAVLNKWGIGSSELPGEGLVLMQVKEFLDSLSEQQQMQFLGMLDPTQRTALMTMISQMGEGTKKDDGPSQPQAGANGQGNGSGEPH